MFKTVFVGTAIFLAASCVNAQEASFTTGPATTISEGLKDCGPRSRISPVGEISDDDGNIWTVPAKTHFGEAEMAADLFNGCGGIELDSLSQLDLADVPLLDAGGAEEFVVYLFADNYFELYVNGTLLAIDPVPFTPFNSNVIRFKAERPLTVAVMMVDWEEHLGIGSEKGRGAAYHPGDGGLVAHFQDAEGKTVALTDASWRAQVFYIAPLKDQNCLVVDGQVRDSSGCDLQGVDDGTGFSAAHWMVPDDWMVPGFDDSIWPYATTYANETVGVDNKKSYTNFIEIFDASGADADFIWSSNLVLDNLVLLRTTIK